MSAATLAGLAVTSWAPVHAQAASARTAWDRVAACESGGDWHIDTGNGYYGGLQFTASTWTGYRGAKYADRADHATRAEQIEVARRVLAAQGTGAWPVCSVQGGLTMSNGGATSAPLPAEVTLAGGTAHRDKLRHANAKVRHANAKARAKSRRARAHGLHAHGLHAHRTTAHRSPSRPGASATRHYRVRSGDTLAGLALRLHITGGWHALWLGNRARVPNPNVLHIGQVLRIPSS